MNKSSESHDCRLSLSFGRRQYNATHRVFYVLDVGSLPPPAFPSTTPSSAAISLPIISIYCPPSSSCIDLIDIIIIKMSPSPGAVFLLLRSASIRCGSICHSSRVPKRAWRSRMHPSTLLRPTSRCWVTSHPPPTNSDNDCELSSLFGVDPPGE